jgi:hypothetical protein
LSLRQLRRVLGVLAAQCGWAKALDVGLHGVAASRERHWKAVGLTMRSGRFGSEEGRA